MYLQNELSDSLQHSQRQGNEKTKAFFYIETPSILSSLNGHALSN